MRLIGADSPGRRRPLTGHPAVLLLLIVLLGMALRLFHIDQVSLWDDELFSRYYPGVGLGVLWTKGFLVEPNPPGFYTLLAGWMRIFGSSETALRSLSVVASSAAIPVVYLLGRQLSGVTVGLLGALLLALSPTAIYFSHEVRVYAFLLLPISVALLGIARFLQAPASTAALVTYGAAAIAALYSHATAMVFLAACNLAVLGAMLWPRSTTPVRYLPRWIAANACIALAAIPVLLTAVSPTARNMLTWIPPLGLHDALWTVEYAMLGPWTPTQRFGYAAATVLLLLIAASLFRDRIDRPCIVVLIAIPALYYLLILGLSLRHSVLLGRVLAWTSVPFCLLLANRMLVASPLRRLLCALVVVTFGVGLAWQCLLGRPDTVPWRSFVAALAPDISHADLVVVGPATMPLGMAYYAPQIRDMKRWNETEPVTVENTMMPALVGVAAISRQDLVRQITAHRHVLLILGADDMPLLPALLAEVPPPRRRFDADCGDKPCLYALTW